MILEKITEEEKKSRKEKCSQLTNFVKRRNLDSKITSIYEKKINEVWKFANSSEHSLDEVSLIDEE